MAIGLRPFKKAAAECDFAPEGTSTNLHLGVLFLFFYTFQTVCALR